MAALQWHLLSSNHLTMQSPWTEHRAPNGQPYYYNPLTKESTYVHPDLQQVAPKKEKPHLKTPIPGTEWIKVATTEGNVFYSNKVTKQSVWTVPEELKPALEAMHAAEKAAAEPAPAPKKSSQGKRKAEESVPVDEVVINKKSKVDEEAEDAEDDDESEEEEEEEEEWQREAAAQLAAEAEEEKQLAEEREMEAKLEAQRLKETIEAAIPQRVDLSIEEGKALFKTLLREKDINPLHPWDTSLPKFIQDPRYVLLPSVAARREAFDEYCKERARELRQSNVKKEKEAAASPKEEYENLLKDEVKSTRASWTDFRRAWKKDRRFYGWGRDDREREKRFREYLKELGEKKRAAAEKAEANFFALLKEHITISEGLSWKEVKARRPVYKDPRYDAVGSSSLREELFNTFLKGKASITAKDTSEEAPGNEETDKDEPSDRQERRAKAVKEREEKIHAERRRLDADIERSKKGIDQEEGERFFMTLLTDAIREPQMTWEKALPQLKTDPRFNNSPLSLNNQIRLFHAHTGHLRAKQITNLHALFEAHAPSLATSFASLPIDTLLASAPVARLGYEEDQLQNEFEKWQRERTTQARAAFDEMMAENSFVEFWGRLGKIGGQSVGESLKLDGDDIGEAGEDDEKVDMKTLAKSVDIREMEKVLKNDKRYITFDHVPDQREKWLRNYLSGLSAPKLSVHING
ncbi:hypothetical protein D9619_001107 [Psilocybe cf. subviscida]|uniref:WW domain-containing protein n=1 Tax=Psilocybe cf. subviscida TaxID=2480587 RepID=A0A8H5BDI1_9AGAR|nr:hypothetical protein D9619_001107 [Psilocybe cf. subviscida]